MEISHNSEICNRKILKTNIKEKENFSLHLNSKVVYNYLA